MFQVSWEQNQQYYPQFADEETETGSLSYFSLHVVTEVGKVLKLLMAPHHLGHVLL